VRAQLRHRNFREDYCEFVSLHAARVMAGFFVSIAIDPAHLYALEAYKEALRLPIAQFAFQYADLMWQCHQAGGHE
jgi:hypothetical protein